MKEINFAYSILSDKDKRKVYDEALKAKGKNREYYEDSDSYADSEDGKNNGQQAEKTELDEEWEFACEYYPELTSVYTSLRKISHELANCFKLWLLIRKDFDQIEEISRSMKKSFMENKFGINPQILGFAEEYIEKGRKDVLRELNKAVVIFGSKIDPNIILNKIINKFGLINEGVKSEDFSPKNRSMHLDNLWGLKSSLEFYGTIKSAKSSLNYLGYDINCGKESSGPYQIKKEEFQKNFETVEEVVEFTKDKLERMIMKLV